MTLSYNKHIETNNDIFLASLISPKGELIYTKRIHFGFSSNIKSSYPLKFYFRKLKDSDNSIQEIQEEAYNFFLEGEKESIDHVESWKKSAEFWPTAIHVWGNNLQNNINGFEIQRDVYQLYRQIFDSNFDTDTLLSQLLDNCKEEKDVLVQVLNYDKIESTLRNRITTSKCNVNEYFFNYLIMGYNISQVPKLTLLKSENKFVISKHDKFSCEKIRDENSDYAKEVKLIKKLVPLNQRDKYLI